LRFARILQIDLLFELLPELARHATRAAYPAADLGCHTREFFRSQHNECQDENEQNL
jgi:hypothetical protein